MFALNKKLLQPQTSKPKPRGQARKNALEKGPIAKPIKENKTNKRTCQKNITFHEYLEDKLPQAIMQT